MSYDVAQTFRKDQATGKVTLAGDGRKALTDADIGPHAGQVAVNNAHDPATLDLDFANGRYRLEDGSPAEITDPTSILIVTRASPKWVFGPNGVLREVPIDTLARDFDPVTHEPRGVLIEESRTNLLTYSEAFDNAAWSKKNVTLTPSAATSPDGTLSAFKVVTPISGDALYHSYVRQGIGDIAGSTYSYTIFAKAGEYSFISFSAADRVNVYEVITVDLTTGTITQTDNINSGTPGIHTVTDAGDGWWRITITKLADGAIDTTNKFLISSPGTGTPGKYNKYSYTADGTSGIYIWGAQLEQASTPSSYIPTTSAAVTRDGDNVSRSLGAEFNPSEGTFVVEYDRAGDLGSTSSRGFFISDDASAVESFGVNFSNNLAFLYSDAGGVSSHASSISIPEEKTTVAASYSESGSTMALALKGISRSSAFNQLTTARQFYVGSRKGTNHASGHFGDVTYYPYAMTAAELEALTTP